MTEKNRVYNLTVETAGERLDKFLGDNVEEASRSYIQKLIESGKLSVNGKVETSKKLKLKEGDELSLEIPEPEELLVEPEDIPLDIVYEDDDVLVVNKAKGMVVHPAVGNYTGTLVNAIMFHCKDRLSTVNGVIRPGIVHRIDKDTSGLLMIAKNDRSHQVLSDQLSEHSITRKYYALVFDNIPDDEGTIDKPIGRDPKNRMRQAVNYDNGKNAVTHFKVLKRFGKYTLIEAQLETGRTHQIRVHMASINHPLVGDKLYCRRKDVEQVELANGSKRKVEGQMLHAKVLGFVHPNGEYMEFDSELPQYFEEIISEL
ncbi:MAG: RluA family pseudouridine synthase [Clostridia bacterium]|nr:RluA family pseudouridine synthase [Clostridia bacterium]